MSEPKSGAKKEQKRAAGVMEYRPLQTSRINIGGGRLRRF
jgi:hypothetical protein